MLRVKRTGPKTAEYLCHPGPADAEVAGQSSLALKLTGVEQGLVVAGELQGVAAFASGCPGGRFGVAGTVPGADRDDRRSM